MRMTVWIAMTALALMISTALGSAPRALETNELTELTRREPWPRPDYSGHYQLTYQRLAGELELCVQRADTHRCALMTVELPMQRGQISSRAVRPLLSQLRTRIGTLLGRLDSKTEPAATSLRRSQCELLTSQLHLQLRQLPGKMEVREVAGNPMMVAFLELMGQPTLFPGQIEPGNGRFSLSSELMTGRIQSTRQFTGRAVLQVPIDAALYDEAQDEREGFSMMLRGTLRAQVRLDRQSLGKEIELSITGT